MKFEKWQVRFILWNQKEYCPNTYNCDDNSFPQILEEEGRLQCINCGVKFPPKNLPKNEQEANEIYASWVKNSSWKKIIPQL
jgi:hypothetical protein